MGTGKVAMQVTFCVLNSTKRAICFTPYQWYFSHITAVPKRVKRVT